MIVYEKNNKLNINFDNELDNPDIEIGKSEIKLGESEITANSVLPVPEEGDTGKVVTVQKDGTYGLENPPSGLPEATASDAGKVVSVDENGNYELVNIDTSIEPFIINISQSGSKQIMNKTANAIINNFSKTICLGSLSGGTGGYYMVTGYWIDDGYYMFYLNLRGQLVTFTAYGNEKPSRNV